MSLSSWEAWNWFIGFVGYVVLMGVLVKRERYRTFPWFTFLLGQEMVQTLILFFLHQHATRQRYSSVYWAFELGEVFIRIGVLFELARTTARLLRENGSERVRALMNAVIVAAAICAGLILGVHGVGNLMVTLALKISLCSSILSGLLIISFVLTTFLEGVRTRIHSQALAYGMFFYFLGKLLAQAGLLFGGTHLWFELQTFTQPLYIVCLFGWSIILWFDEPQQILNEEMERLRQTCDQVERRFQVARQQDVYTMTDVLGL